MEDEKKTSWKFPGRRGQRKFNLWAIFHKGPLKEERQRYQKYWKLEKKGKLQFMVMDKLIIYDRPLDPDKNRNGRSSTELSENDDDDKVLLSNRLHRK